LERVAILGTGLIGGSIGLRLAADPALRTVGWDASSDAAELARSRGAVDEIVGDARAAVAGADLVIAAVPGDALAATFATIAGAVATAAVVTDVASAKVGAVRDGEASFGGRFVGGHPMAGSERHGIAAATPDLFDDASWILTPTSVTSAGAYGRAAALATSVGGRPVAVAPDVHDQLVARLSHLPQLLASVLVDVAASAGDRDALLRLAGGGFRDTTRIAASDPDLWVSILKTNREAVLDSLSSLEQRLSGVRSAIERGDWADVRAGLARARAARVDLFAKADVGGEPMVLAMSIPDRPGVLAEVTTAAGELGANIEDLSIFHSPEGGRGRLELVVTGARAAAALASRLADLGYVVASGPKT